MPNRSHGHYFKLGMHTHTVRFSKASNHFFTQYKAWDILDRDKIWKIHDEQINTAETVRDQPVARTQDALPEEELDQLSGCHVKGAPCISLPRSPHVWRFNCRRDNGACHWTCRLWLRPVPELAQVCPSWPLTWLDPRGGQRSSLWFWQELFSDVHGEACSSWPLGKFWAGTCPMEHASTCPWEMSAVPGPAWWNLSSSAPERVWFHSCLWFLSRPKRAEENVGNVVLG